MKISLLTTILILTVSQLYSQRIHYGYPNNNYTLKKGDILILNLPAHNHGRFVEFKDFDALASIISSNPKIEFNIYLNVFFLSSLEKNNSYSEHLYRDLKQILANEVKGNNFKIICNYSNYPIFLDKTDNNYNFYNSRLEIKIE